MAMYPSWGLPTMDRGSVHWYSTAHVSSMECGRISICTAIESSPQRKTMGMTPPVTSDEVFGLIEEGCRRFDRNEALYLRPMMWSGEGGPGVVEIDP